MLELDDAWPDVCKQVHNARKRESSMNTGAFSPFKSILAMLSLLMICGSAQAIEVKNLEGFEDLFGRYAPGGDCNRQPHIVVERTGFSFEVGGNTDTVTNPELAASYGGNYYRGITQWFFPFRSADGFAVLMSFNYQERPGQLNVEGHDEGWSGGPPLTPRNKALVDGSPYAKCP